MADPTGDKWADAVMMFTGMLLPARDKVFTDIHGNDNIPLMNVTISEVWMWDRNGPLNQSWGYVHEGHTYTVLLFKVIGDQIHSYKAYIDFLWDAHESAPGGSTGANLDIYSNGPWYAFSALSTHYSTKGITYGSGDSGIGSVAIADAVDLTGFTAVSRAFDRTQEFFREYEKKLKDWVDGMDSGSASWKGNGAQQFTQVLTEMSANYTSWSNQMGSADYAGTNAPLEGGTPANNRPGDALIGLEKSIHTSAGNLLGPFNSWQASYKSRILKILDDEIMAPLVNWVDSNQTSHVSIHSTNDQYGDFSPESAKLVQDGGLVPTHPLYGDLTQMSAWAAIGNAAIKAWWGHIDTDLAGVAGTEMANVDHALNEASVIFEGGFTTSSTTSTSDPNTNISTDTPDGNTSLPNATDRDIPDPTGTGDTGTGDTGIGDTGIGDTGTGDTGTGTGGTGTTTTNTPISGADVNSAATTAVNDALDGTGAGIGATATTTGISGATLGDTGTGTGTTTPVGTGGVTVRNADGSLTTTYPDGTVRTVDADGTVHTSTEDGSAFTTSPDGTVSTGTTVTPIGGATGSGATTTQNADGSITTKHTDGSSATAYPDGSETYTAPDGTVTHITPDGTETVTTPNGTVSTTTPSGGTTITSPNGTVSTVGSDGVLHTQNPNGTTTLTNPDGSKLTVHPDGGVKNTYSIPGASTGSAGTGTSAALSGSAANAGSVNSVNTGQQAGYDLSTDFTGANGAADVGSSYLGSAAASTAAEGTGGMPMGGMGGMGGGQGGQGESKGRVREVIGGETGRAAPTRLRPTPARIEEETPTAAPRTETASGVPVGTGGPGGGPATESQDRDREHWLAEDDDVWGVEEGGSPAVIGR
ncbi:AAWKG family protein [Streptomyces sp. NPDC058469]|uniref:AAWKG family protein n=1 Tax=Streptomyces sp. NPDC058469 TaxID=3346514 RepID=UPI0036496A2D